MGIVSDTGAPVFLNTVGPVRPILFEIFKTIVMVICLRQNTQLLGRELLLWLVS